MLFIPSFKVFSVFFFSCFTQFGGTSLSLNIFDKFRNAAPLKWPIWRLQTKKDIFFSFCVFFFFSRYLKKFHLFLSMNKKLQENGTILITTAIPRQCGYPFRLSDLLCRVYMFGHASLASVKVVVFLGLSLPDVSILMTLIQLHTREQEKGPVYVEVGDPG